MILKLCTVHVSSHPALPNCNVQCNWLVEGGGGGFCTIFFSFLVFFLLFQYLILIN